MDDFIKDLKTVSGEVDMVREKNEAIQKSMSNKNEKPRHVTSDDLRVWLGVVDDLRENLNEYSFRTFIEPLSLLASEKDAVIVGSPADSVSWIVDHYLDMITESYEKVSGRRAIVEIKQG